MENMNIKSTDLAVEFTLGNKKSPINKNIKRTEVTVNEEMSKKLNKPQGKYITIESDAVKKGRKNEYDSVAREISKVLLSIVKSDNCLIACLGNPDMTADALGKRVADKLVITRHLKDLKSMPKISCVCPNVLGVTGVESFDIIKGVTERIKPSAIIVIDSLAGATTARIASAFQVSSAGITPGSGVSNHRMRFDKESLGVDVYSLGVPLVVYASTIIHDALKDNPEAFGCDDEIASLVVTPKDIDIYVEDCAKIIASAINLTFFGDTFSI